jgi:hypothetical protein
MTVDNTIPSMRACCSVIRAAEEEFGVARLKVASILGGNILQDSNLAESGSVGPVEDISEDFEK